MNLDVLISGAIRKFRNRTAVYDEKRSVGFTELGERTNRLGSALAALGLGRGDRIASLQRNTIEAIETDIMAARFGYVRTLLNARGSAGDHTHCINHCGARALIFGAGFADHVDALRDQLPGVEFFIMVGEGPDRGLRYEDLIHCHDPAPPRWTVDEHHPHSVYYTSGTTGRPKGVLLSQANWLVLVRNHLVDAFSHACETDVLLHATPLSFATGCTVIPHLVRGASQRVLEQFDAERVYQVIERDRVTTTVLVPSTIHMMLDLPGSESFDTASLHTVMYGGAPMAAERIRETHERWGPVLMQGYGQWEAPQLISCLGRRDHVEAVANPARAHVLTSAGRPLSFVRVGIMDDEGHLRPAGTEGEIVTAGDHLMVGYLDNEEATEELREGQWQRTGDIGKLDEDGFLYLTDRKKDVIITGGNNVYPREIEEVLYRHPDLLEAVAVGVPNEQWGETVHVVAAPRRGRRLDGAALVEWCRERLPSDKRPRSATIVDSLPKSGYGKILRREVRQAFWHGRDRRI